ncbi:2585_t:CDS:2 [Paraglomus occultum]|uniref:2585_t:CDS:1 n=1 Tax=Paraglomus occultum TaxID=144539 RepID=A0A9N9CJ18_9GLOM|nr:2585_t:CDS:2 [Paraglomus occultum]
MADYLFTVFSLVAVLFSVVPGIFHIQTRNWGAIFMTFWVAYTNLIDFINSLVWSGDDLLDVAPVYCLITTPIYQASSYGALASVACMIHALYTYVSSTIIITERVRRRRALIDFIVCIIVPTVLAACYYIVQDHKYGLRPVLGCFSPYTYTLLTVFIVHIWPVIFALVGSVYAVLTAYAIVKKRLEIQRLLTFKESGLNQAKFYRLVFFCVSFLIVALPGSLLQLKEAFLFKFYPYSWKFVHQDWNQVSVYDQGVKLVDYFKPLTGIMLFIFFGTGQDALAKYRAWGRMIKLDIVFPFCFRESETESRFTYTVKSSTTEKSQPTNKISQSSLNSSKVLLSASTETSSSYSFNSPKGTQEKKKKGLTNFLFLGGHRTPSEQAAVDMTSGIRIRIDGLDTRTVIDDSIAEEKEPDMYEKKRKSEFYQPPRILVTTTTETTTGSIEETGDVGDVRDSVIQHVEDLLSVYPTVNVIPPNESDIADYHTIDDNESSETGFAL